MTIKITCNTCDTIKESCKQAVILAIKNNEDVVFKFNGIEVKASPESDPDKLINDYLMKYATIFNDALSLEFFDKVDMKNLLPRYLNYDSKNNK
jgi:hypothetical protein